MKPISYSTTTRPTTKPTTRPTTKPASQVPSEELGERRFLDLGGAGTAGDPQVLWVRQSQTFDDALIAEILDGAESLYTILEVRQNDRAAGTLLSRTGCIFRRYKRRWVPLRLRRLRLRGEATACIFSEVTTAPPMRRRTNPRRNRRRILLKSRRSRPRRSRQSRIRLRRQSRFRPQRRRSPLW